MILIWFFAKVADVLIVSMDQENTKGELKPITVYGLLYQLEKYPERKKECSRNTKHERDIEPNHMSCKSYGHLYQLKLLKVSMTKPITFEKGNAVSKTTR